MRIRAACFLLLMALPLAAQTKRNTDMALRTFRLVNVQLSGSQRYTAADVKAATGLRTGEDVTSDTLNAAAAKLGHSGAFLTVDYQFFGVPNGIEAVFKALDNPEMARPVFENLVWLQPEELDRALRARVPLFKGMVPGAGTMQDEVAAVLTDLLSKHGVNSKIAVEPRGMPGKPVSVLAFRATDVSPNIESVKFVGAAKVDPALLDKEAQAMTGTEYQVSFVTQSCNSFVKRLYTARGFLAVTFAMPQYAITHDDPQQPSVALTIPVNEGPLYTVKSVTWAGNTVYDADALNAAMVLQIGHPADLPKYEQDLLNVRKMYAMRGYMRIRWEVVPELLPDNTAAINIRLQEGKQYKMRRLAFENAGSAEPELRKRWTLAEGAVYDDSYARDFLISCMRILPPRAELRYREAIDDEQATVDVTVQVRWPSGAPMR